MTEVNSLFKTTAIFIKYEVISLFQAIGFIAKAFLVNKDQDFVDFTN